MIFAFKTRTCTKQQYHYYACVENSKKLVKTRVVTCNSADGSDPVNVVPTDLVYHVPKNEALPDDIIKGKNGCYTTAFRDYVLRYCHCLPELKEEYSRCIDLIDEIVNAELVKREVEIAANYPSVVGFSIYNFKGSKVILVHDLTENAEYPIIGLLKFRSTENKCSLMTLYDYIESVRKNIGDDKLSEVTFVLPANVEVFNSVIGIYDRIAENSKYIEPFKIVIPKISYELGKGKLIDNAAKRTCSAIDCMNEYVEQSFNCCHNEIRRRHEIISGRYTAKDAIFLRRILLLKKL